MRDSNKRKKDSFENHQEVAVRSLSLPLSWFVSLISSSIIIIFHSVHIQSFPGIKVFLLLSYPVLSFPTEKSKVTTLFLMLLQMDSEVERERERERVNLKSIGHLFSSVSQTEVRGSTHSSSCSFFRFPAQKLLDFVEPQNHALLVFLCLEAETKEKRDFSLHERNVCLFSFFSFE